MVIQQDRLAEDDVTKLLDVEFSDRIQILSAPIQLPGVCGLCGTARTDDRSYVDIGLWVEFYGHFYFCTFCMSQFVNRLGGLTAEQADELKLELEQARQTIIDFQQEKAAVDGAINTLRSTGLFSGIDLTVIGSDVSVVKQQDTVQDITSSVQDKLRTTEANSNTTESTGDTGSDGISSSGNDELDSWL